MPLITSIENVQHSLLTSFLSECHYQDDFALALFEEQANIQQLTALFLDSAPLWVDALMRLRDAMVEIFGLKTAPQERPNFEDIHFQEGKRIGIFQVYALEKEAILLGEEDRHLDFRVLLHLRKKPYLNGNQGDPTKIENPQKKKTELVLTTTVRFHGVWGRRYFLVIRPFHKLVVKAMLQRLAERLQAAK